MSKLKRLWLCRDDYYYVMYIGRRPSGRSLAGVWCNGSAYLCIKHFEATHSIRLAPGEGPVEVTPLTLKKGIRK